MSTSLISKEIINNISESSFKYLKVKSIIDYGAQGDGRKDNTKIFKVLLIVFLKMVEELCIYRKGLF